MEVAPFNQETKNTFLLSSGLSVYFTLLINLQSTPLTKIYYLIRTIKNLESRKTQYGPIELMEIIKKRGALLILGFKVLNDLFIKML